MLYYFLSPMSENESGKTCFKKLLHKRLAAWYDEKVASERPSKTKCSLKTEQRSVFTEGMPVVTLRYIGIEVMSGCDAEILRS